MAGRHRSYHHLSLEQHRRISPPELRLIEDQRREIQTLLHDNQRLAATYVTLKQEVAATEQDLHHLAATAASVKAEREAQVREFYDRLRKLDDEAHTVAGLPAELDRVRSDIEELQSERKELVQKLKDVDGDLKRTHLELEQLPPLKADIESMRTEIHRGRSAIEYERKTRAKNFELSEAMEKHVASLSREAQNLRSELADAEKKAMAAAAAEVTAANPDHGYGYATHPGNLENGYAGNSLPGPYAVHQGSVDLTFHYGLGAGAHSLQK